MKLHYTIHAFHNFQDFILRTIDSSVEFSYEKKPLTNCRKDFGPSHVGSTRGICVKCIVPFENIKKRMGHVSYENLVAEIRMVRDSILSFFRYEPSQCQLQENIPSLYGMDCDAFIDLHSNKVARERTISEFKEFKESHHHSDDEFESLKQKLIDEKAIYDENSPKKRRKSFEFLTERHQRSLVKELVSKLYED